VQPLTVTVLDAVDPGPPEVEDELETEPPPAWTWTDEPPAELLLERLPALPVVEEAPDPVDAPSAVMLPSACLSTDTLQVPPDAVLPVFMIVSAQAVPPIIPMRTATAVNFVAWAI